MRTDLIGRAVLPIAALLTLAADAPRPVPGALALGGVALVAERLARLRALGTTDRVLVGVGGVLVALVLTGMVLGSTALGLGPTSWILALSALSAAGLVVAALDRGRRPATTGPATNRRTGWLLLPWIAVAAVVVGLAVQVSAASLAEVEAEPVQMSFGEVRGTRVQVVVSADEASGPFELRASGDGGEISYPLLDVAAGGSSVTTVSLPVSGRYVITLSHPDQTQPLRTLVLDR